MSATIVLSNSLKKSIRLLPLAVRKRLAVWVHRAAWIPEARRRWWSQQLVSDFAEVDVNAYHKFLWSNHMAYAHTYDVEQRFGDDNIKPSRRIFLEYLDRVLAGKSVAPSDIDSVFDVGCSLGYLLRHLETGVFSSATRFAGIDIDANAIREGRAYLGGLGSKVQIERGDMEDLGRVLDSERYDVFLCLGVLMYLDEAKAASVVRCILDHTGVVAGFAGLAHPETDNAKLGHSPVRDEDGSFIHNIDRMVTAAGGRVIGRRWEGSQLVDDNSIYFVFAAR